MRQKLTVLIPCKNEQRNIRPCIESAREIADEMLVADSGSTDATLDIVRELGCRLIEREYVNSADFKNWAIPQAAHPWVLVVDADERVTPQLAAEIKGVLADSPRRDGYRILRQNYFFGHPIYHCGWNTDDVLRLFRKDVCHYQTRRVHAGVIVDTGSVGRLRGKFLHYTYWTFNQYFEKFGRYTTWAAQDWYDAGKKAGFFKLLLRPPIKFLHLYVLRLGFLDGLPGLMICMLSGMYVLVKYAKLWALHHARPQPDPEAVHKKE